MKNRTLVKSKIVLNDNGTCLTIYLWKRTFWIFGYWYPFGTSSSSVKLVDGIVKRISDKQVAKVLFDEFVNSENWNK